MKDFINFPEFHCHPQSLDTGSTPEAFAERELELDTGTLTITDHGTLSACRKVYELGRKKKLTPILGLESYFRDDACDILTASGEEKDAKGTFTPYAKYFHLTMHALDQEAYETMVRVLSYARLNREEKHGSEYKPLFDWNQLEELGSKNITFGSGCLIGMVQRHLLLDRPDLAVKYYERLRGLVKPGNFYVEMFPHVCDTFWCDKIFVHLEDGTSISYYDGKTIATNAGEIKLEELVKVFDKDKKQHTKLLAIKNKNTWQEVESKNIVRVEKVEGFLPNECKPWAVDGDYQKGTNLFMRELAAKYHDPIAVAGDSHLAVPEDKIVQDIKLRSGGGSWRFSTSYHRQSSAEAFEYFKTIGVSEDEFRSWTINNRDWASRFKDFKFKDRVSLPSKFYPADTVDHLKTLIDKHGRMDWSNQKMLDRLGSEITLLNQNGTVDLLPYFFLSEEACAQYEENGLLSGPGRGSAAGMLIAYLLGITHVDPLRYNLSQDRFLTLDRIQTGKLPDVDSDFANRDLLIHPQTGWLKRRFGDHYAQISVDTTLRLRNSIKDVARVMHNGIVPPDIEKLAGKLPDPPQGIADKDFVFGYKGSDGSWTKGIIDYDDSLQEYIKKYPDEWEMVKRCLGVTRNKSRHASAYVVCNEPISNFIPTFELSGTVCTDYTANSVEASGGIKLDILGLDGLARLSTGALLVQERNGGKRTESMVIDGKLVPAIRQIPFNGRYYDIWDLPPDQAVFRNICEGKTESTFQLNQHAALLGLREFNNVKFIERDGTIHKAIDSIEDLAAFTALDRPGPLDAFVEDGRGERHNMLVEFANRAKGLPKVGAFPILDKLFPETYGVLVYQEQLQNAYQTIGKTTAIEANNFRQHVGKKLMAEVMKDKIIFMKGALETLSEKEATQLWNTMETFGQYGFNRSIDGNTILESVNEGQKRIKDFKAGDTINGVDENGNKTVNKVVALHDHGLLPAFEVVFDDGNSVISSINHKFLTIEGQKPLHEIIKRDLKVLSQPDANDKKSTTPASQILSRMSQSKLKAGSTSKIMDSKMWFNSQKSNNFEEPSQSVSTLQINKNCQHTNKAINPQPKSISKTCSVDDCQKDFGKEGYSITKSKTVTCMAESPSNRTSSKYDVGSQGQQEIQGGRVVADKWNSELARCSNTMWGGSKTGGFCFTKSQDMDRSGRFFPFFRNQSNQTSITQSTSSRQDVSNRSETKNGYLPNQIGGKLFPFVRWQDERQLEGMAYSDAPLTSTGNLVLRNIVRVSYVGKRRMYDLEVSHPKHNFLLPNGIVTSNSHAVSYMIITYATAFFKHHYPLEWWTAVLRNEKDRNKIDTEHWRYCSHLVDMPDIKLSGDGFQIVGNRIRAPLSLLHGIGEKAHEELIKIHPVESITELCDKVRQLRIANAKVMIDKNTNLPKKDKKGNVRMSLGRSALNKGIISTLIVSGAANSLFPPESGVFDQLMEYEKAKALINGKKKPEPVDPKYANVTPIVRYQMKKKVLPAWSEPLNDIFLNMGIEGFKRLDNGKFRYIAKRNQIYEEYPVASFSEIEAIDNISLMPDMTIRVSSPCYIVSDERKKYQANKNMAKLQLDISGGRFEFIKWPDKRGNLPEVFDEDLTGSVCLVLMSKFSAKKPFGIDNIVVIQKPLGDMESSPEEE